ncbi:hypothetical protein GPECTOR_15g516 [Gonium pectorale]|uniref:Neutral/alkaline non-lysosomal ceramidase C-terminal domain-containing protein n=1 Tax=Gonium pectorale TaxID=33097 RepID=A0A150GNA7_GONPE|nr:hypothetical protein GPECTOR_15g516 [Gonium pectorale]|eukprot:KXZ50830.1 hypothetical protein GPECTOR_15g516 [Gonium pectorale]
MRMRQADVGGLRIGGAAGAAHGGDAAGDGRANVEELGRLSRRDAAATATAAAMAAAAQREASGAAPSCESDGENTWQAVLTDRDWVTRFRWHRPFKLSPESYATLEWDIPAATPPGTYRFRYFGDAKSLAGGTRPFEGCSAPFLVAEAEDAEGA